MNKFRFTNLLPFLIAMPAIIIGALAMYLNNVPALIWSQNLLCLCIAGLISFFVLSREHQNKTRNSLGLTIPTTIILILLTFIDSGLGGVHRWVSIGPVRLYIASIVLPVLFIELWRILQTKNWWIPTAITLGVSVMLAIQPDASQITAFIIPMFIMLLWKTKNNIFRYGALALLPLLIIISWVFLDSLPPVAYVEKIVNMVAGMGVFWLVLGIVSLIILPLPFILSPPRNFRLLSICLGLYFAIVTVSTLFGNFPVPLMGYGISPITGYFIAITWFVRSKKEP